METYLEPDHEAGLVRQAQRDPSQFNALYRVYVKRVYAYVAYRLNHPHEAEDLTAMIFVQVLQRLSQYDPTRGSFAAWLFGVAHYAVIDYWRRDKPQPVPLEMSRSIPSTGASPEAVFIDSERDNHVRRMIALLPKRRQEVVILKFFAGLRNKEIAAVLALDERTVASHLSRALDDLKQHLVKEEQHDPI